MSAPTSSEHVDPVFYGDPKTAAAKVSCLVPVTAPCQFVQRNTIAAFALRTHASPNGSKTPI